MTVRALAAFLGGLVLVACGSAPPPPPAPPPPAEEHEPAPEEPAPEPPPPPPMDNADKSRSTASYEEAMAVPEPLDVRDERAHLTDAQLTGPMRGVISSCRLPSNARVNIRTAVQNGRAIGVTVNVRIERPKTKRPPSKALVKADAKLAAKITTCVDSAVRGLTWPPSRRRDSFTTDF